MATRNGGNGTTKPSGGTSHPIAGGLTNVTSTATRAIVDRTKKPSSNPGASNSGGPGGDHPIGEALKEKLPTLPSGKDSNFTDTGYQTMKEPTGKATQQAKPPMAWKAEDKDFFLKTYFTDEAAKISAPGRAPQLEASFRLSNEADVVRASAVYLLNVVNIAAQAWLDQKFEKKIVLKCTTEVTSTNSNSGEPQDADKTDTTKPQTRTDVQWSLETAAEANGEGPTEPHCVALMEYKRKHLINPKELDAARFYEGDEVGTFMEDAQTKGGGPTYFDKTSLWLVKQVKAYQMERKVKDVCLFDWDTMFLLNFDAFNPNDDLDTKGKGSSQQEPELWPAGILHQEQANSSKGAAAESTFRSLLLAFLIRALKRDPKLSGSDKSLAAIKYDQSPRSSSGENPGKKPQAANPSGQSTEPAKPDQPSQPAKPDQPSQPAKPGQPSPPPKPGQPSAPPKPSQPDGPRRSGRVPGQGGSAPGNGGTNNNGRKKK